MSYIFNKNQQDYCYTNLCNYREEFVLKPISNISNILVCYNLSLTRSLNVSYFQTDGQSSVDWTPSKNKKLSPIFNFTCCNIFALKENHCSKKANHPPGFRHGETSMSHWASELGKDGVGVSPCQSKS